MKQLVFLLEEESMKALLDILLPQILPPEIEFRCIHHEGKSDLEKSIPIKLRAWQAPALFVIVRDKDRADCREVKKHLINLCLLISLDLFVQYLILVRLDRKVPIWSQQVQKHPVQSLFVKC